MGRFAYVFGSNGSDAFDRLRYAEQDAENIAAALSGPRCGFSVKRPAPGADTYDLRRQLNQLVSECKTEDTFICYFAGHGVLDAGELFLVWDSTTPDLFTTALPVADLVAAMRRCKARNKLLILDCCHAGGAVGLRDGLGTPVEEFKITAANHLVLMASGRLEKARELEDIGGGFLAVQICLALGEHFHDADRDRDQRLSIKELMAWLEECAERHNRYHPRKVPCPRLFGEQLGDFFLTADLSSGRPCELTSPDDSTIVLLPVAPISVLSFNDGFSQRFAIGVAKHPVTNAQYRRFLESSGYQRSPEETSPRGPVGEAFVSDAPDRPGRWQGPFEPWKDPAFNDPRQPVVCVSYDDALAYCKWVNTNLFRSSEDGIVDVVPYSIWDYATFGTEYPTHNPSGWMSGAERAHHKSSAPALVDMERSRTNERGISDLLGNVWEWCSTMYGTLVRSDFRIERGERPQLRGGSFLDDLTQIEPFLRASELRDGPRTRHADLGFRIFMLIPLASLPEPVRTRLKLCRSLDGLEHHLQRSVLGENTDF